MAEVARSERVVVADAPSAVLSSELWYVYDQDVLLRLGGMYVLDDQRRVQLTAEQARWFVDNGVIGHEPLTELPLDERMFLREISGEQYDTTVSYDEDVAEVLIPSEFRIEAQTNFLRVSEQAVVQDASMGQLVTRQAVDETTPIHSATDAAQASCIRTETAAIADSSDVVLHVRRAIETSAVADLVSAVATLRPSRAETAAITTVQIADLSSRARAESAAVADISSAALQAGGQIAESLAAADLASTIASMRPSRAETTAAADLASVVSRTSATQAETAAIAAAQDAVQSLCSRAETAVVAETQSARAAARPSLAETAGAADSQSATKTTGSSLAETVAVADAPFAGTVISVTGNDTSAGVPDVAAVPTFAAMMPGVVESATVADSASVDSGNWLFSVADVVVDMPETTAGTVTVS